MSIIAWILLGLVAGFIASKLVSGSGKGLVVDMVLGVIGAFVGGGLFHLIGRSGVTGFNLWSVFVAVVARWSCSSATTPSRDAARRLERGCMTEAVGGRAPWPGLHRSAAS